MTKSRLASTRGSAAWAAWGDALGFITELTDASGVMHRAGLERITDPVRWRRRVGGHMGVTVDLPAGTYSDDTQLRLATSRAIRGDGEFDVDCFARVELVSWQAYHLGAGRGSKAAAAGMTRSEARWSQNTFNTKRSRYVDVGGNGAAMRIHPHVWSASDLTDPVRVLPDVIRNTVCTHGHPIGILGAVFHAVCLMVTMDRGAVPAPGHWKPLAEMAGAALDIVATEDRDLAGLWRPAWELAAGRPLLPALQDGLRELQQMLDSVTAIWKEKGEGIADRYLATLDAVGGMDPATRGSGVGTAVAALALAASAEENPAGALRLAANVLGSDTDTIATMAGSLIGAVVADHPPSPFQDVNYVDREAYRMHAIATGAGLTLPTFRYPDLFEWSPPRSALDLVGSTTGGGVALAGLGDLVEAGPPIQGASRSSAVYQWMELPFGQRIFVRFRQNPKPLMVGMEPAKLLSPPQPEAGPGSNQARQEQLPVPTSTVPRSVPAIESIPLGLDEAVASIRAKEYDPHQIGFLLLRLIKENPAQALAHASAFAAIVAQDLKAQ